MTFCSSLKDNRSHLDNVVRNLFGLFTLMTDDPSCGLHSATIIGSKPYVDESGNLQCKFIVQDTYGNDCNFGVSCKDGISEIDSKVLLMNTLEVDSIK